MVLGPPKIVVSPPETKENKLYLKLANNMYSSRINQRKSQEKKHISTEHCSSANPIFTIHKVLQKLHGPFL